MMLSLVDDAPSFSRVSVLPYRVKSVKNPPAVLSLWQQGSDSSQNGFLTERW